MRDRKLELALNTIPCISVAWNDPTVPFFHPQLARPFVRWRLPAKMRRHLKMPKSRERERERALGHDENDWILHLSFLMFFDNIMIYIYIIYYGDMD